MIEIKHLSKTFQMKDGAVNALKDIDLTIPDGSIYGIIGMSGAGKSTLVRCINLLERPTEGSVVIDGTAMETLSPAALRERRRDITMIFQQFNLLMQRSCLKNICFPMELAGVKKADAEKRAKELLEMVGLPDKANAYPAQLSGGQKQRIAIARALATDPKVLLCDEATSALDPNTTHAILTLIKDINKKLSIEQINLKRTLGHKQDELKDKLFVELRDMLANFMETAEYDRLLDAQVADAVKIADGEPMIIYIDPADEKKLHNLAMQHQADVRISEYSFLGGTRAVIPGKNILIDNSFQARLAEARENFQFDSAAQTGGTIHG